MSEVLNWIKSHLAIVIMCAVSIIVLPVVIVLSSSWNKSIAEQIQARARDQESAIKNVSDVDIAITPLTPKDEAVQTRKTINKAILEDYRARREQIKADAQRLEEMAVQINRAGKGDQLVPGLLPAPDRAVAQELPYRVHGAYKQAHEQLIAELNASMPVPPPTVQEQLLEFQDNFVRSQFNVDDPSRLNPTEREKLREAMTAHRLALYAQIAQDYSVYADVEVFNLDEWTQQQAPGPYRWYDWQATYWLNRDIVTAINKANSVDGDRATIIGPDASVVKAVRAIKAEPFLPASAMNDNSRGRTGVPEPLNMRGPEGMGFDTPPMGPEGGMANTPKGMRNMGGADFGGEASPPPTAAPAVDPGALSDPNQPFPPDFTSSISGRVPKTGLYDMRKVTLTLVVDSSRLDELFEAINSTNFMTVVGFRTQALDLKQELANGFMYGSAPVVQADLEIETLWLRDWTVELMPDSVKEHFGIVVPEPEV